MKIISKLYSVILSVISKLFWFFEIFLFLRLLLKFLGANPKALVVGLIYKYSDILVSPFGYIFSNFYWKNHFVEIVTISAIVGYAIAMFLIFQILRLFSQDEL